MKSFTFSDAGNAERLVHLHGSDIRYCPELGGWFVWNGGRWARDQTGAITRRAVQTARSIRAQANGIADEKQRREALSFALRSESAAKLRAMIEVARSLPEIHVKAADLDADPYLLGCDNGTLNLRSGALRESRREDLITQTCGVTFDPAAECPGWDVFLEEVMDGDWERIEYLRRWAGYVLTGSVEEQQYLNLEGEGANGKSTFLETLRFALGDYARQADLTSFLQSRSRSDNIRNDIARLAGARLVTAAESGQGSQLDEVLIKQLTGSDTITARKLYKEHIEFQPTMKLIFAMNDLPAIASQGNGIWRRVRVVTFGKTIAPEKYDLSLRARLRAEASGILNWALVGCLLWQQLGLSEPDAVKESSKRYRKDQDAVREFIEAHCQRKGSIQSSVLYGAFRDACDRDGVNPEITQKAFSKRLAALGFVTKKVAGLHRVGGISLNAR